MGIVLFIVAVFLGGILSCFGFIYGILKAVLGYCNTILLLCAIGIDRMGNVICADMFNDMLIKHTPDVHKFGNMNETVSRVLGINKKTNTLTKFGRGIANILNWIHPNHVELASKEYWKEELIISDFNDNNN
jgi:hypothetical protein